MALQIQMNTIDDAGEATKMYPINRATDVIIGTVAKAEAPNMPCESDSETLETSISLIKAYLSKLKTGAYADIASSLTNDSTTIPTTAMVYSAAEKAKEAKEAANNALLKSGGEMSGYLTFGDYKTNLDHICGLQFKCVSGSAGSQSEKTFTIQALTYTTSGGGGSINAGIGANTLIPLNTTDSLGQSSRPWYRLYVDTISGFKLQSDITPVSNLSSNLGSEDSLFAKGYFGELSLKNSSYSVATISTFANQYDRYGWRTGLSINTSIVPNNDGGGLCKLGDYNKRWYSLYTSSIYLCPIDTSITSCFALNYYSNLAIHYDSTSTLNSDKPGLRMGDSSNVMSLQLYALDIYTSACFSANRDFTIYSDEKVKKQTNDLSDDIDKLNASLSDINIQSYIYRYNSNQSKQSIGVIAQELENVFISHGIDPFKYGILNVEYNAYINRGSEEDQKYYPKFMTISYEQLNTLALIKMQSLEKKNNELESRLAAIEARLG